MKKGSDRERYDENIEFELLLKHVHKKKSSEFLKLNLDNPDDVIKMKKIIVDDQIKAEKLAKEGKIKIAKNDEIRV